MAAFDRSEALRRLAGEQFDLVVVGGGITGAGVALDAASRGLRTALVERDDFASGTSSRSSKFVHGGLRYLHQREFRLVAESLVEQRRLLRNAPHLVRPLPVLLPVPDGQMLRKLGSAAILKVHDFLGGGGRSRTTGDGVVFHEAQVDDARLTLAALRTAVLDHGAVVANHCPVVRFVPGGVELADGTAVRARAVVNATGVWSNDVDPAAGPPVRPAKGVHVVVSRERIPFETAIVLRLPGENRWAFVTPWEDRAMIGTTDTDYDGPLDEPAATEEDIANLLGAVNLFVSDPLTPADVLSAWAGLRPLVRDHDGGSTADLSRRHRVVTGAGGVVTVVGGKLTTYRRMAADAVDATGVATRRSRTASLRLHGAGVPDAAAPPRLWARYGTQWRTVEASGSADPLVAGLPYTQAEAVYAVRHEMALTLDDVLSRRTRASFLDQAGADRAAPTVAVLLAPELGWSPAETGRQVAAYRAAWPGSWRQSRP